MMPDDQYDQLRPEHPALIPVDEYQAHERLGAAVLAGIAMCEKRVFLEGWWALCWLHPGLHPDDYTDWEFQSWKDFAQEAFTRAERGEITDEELYPAEASHNRILREQEADTPMDEIKPGDRRVVVRSETGFYLGRDGQWTADKVNAARYFLIADKVDQQIAMLHEQTGRALTLEDGR